MTLVFLILIFYFLPSFVATGRKHPNGAAITVLNLFLGWTLLGWVVALIWSVTAQPDLSRAPRPGRWVEDVEQP